MRTFDRFLSFPLEASSLVSLVIPCQIRIFHIRNSTFPIFTSEDSDPGIAGNSVSDRNLQCSTSSFLLIVCYEPDIAGNSVSGEDFRQLSLISLGGFESGIAGNSVSDKNLPYSTTLLSLSLPRSGKGPCIMHTTKKMQRKVGSRYITPIQPYRFCRQLYSCYQIRLCFTIQLNCEDVLVVIWFPCWGPVWSMGWDANATLLFFYSTAPRTSCLGSPVTRYHRLFESRPVNSTRRETYQQQSSLFRLVCPSFRTTRVPCSSRTCDGTSGRKKAQSGTETPL